MVFTDDIEIEESEPIQRLSRDLLLAARNLAPHEVRYVVDGYYQIQEYRKASRNQVSAAANLGEPSTLLSWLASQAETIEGQSKRAMQAWAESRRPGRWLLDQKGIGPVLASGLLAHIDIAKAPTVGHIWTFAGLNPDSKWEKGSKRPWNLDLKVLCWKIGDSFVKVSGRSGAVYGQAYRERKSLEIKRNLQGLFALQAQEALQRPWLSDGQREWYERGFLPPGRIDLRARRWAVKLFLSHLQHVMWEDAYGEPPAKPYVIDILGHAHYLAPPGWPRE